MSPLEIGGLPPSKSQARARLRSWKCRFIAGIALYLGQRSYSFDEKLLVMPLDRLWLPSA
jgi:hypothetical protein